MRNQEAEMYSRNLTLVQDKHDELLKEFFAQNKELETTKKLLDECHDLIHYISSRNCPGEINKKVDVILAKLKTTNNGA